MTLSDQACMYHDHLQVAAGAADLAIGGDQGGSVRLPACWTGIVGLKPTHGLVPYTGAMAMDFSIDHLGPMTRTVRDCALLLEASQKLKNNKSKLKGYQNNSCIYIVEFQRENTLQ